MWLETPLARRRASCGVSNLPAMFPPEGATEVIRGVVYGEAQTAGSKKSGVVTVKDPATGNRVPKRRENGSIMTVTREDDKTGRKETWRTDVRDAVLKVFGDGRVPLDAPLALRVRFFRLRAGGDYRADGSLRPGAKAWADTRPDGTKLVRAFEDALNKIVWKDDGRIVSCWWDKPLTDGPARVEYVLYVLPAKVGEAQPPGQASLALA